VVMVPARAAVAVSAALVSPLVWGFPHR